MDTPSHSTTPRWPALVTAIGAALAILSAGGLGVLSAVPAATPVNESTLEAPAMPAAATQVAEARVERRIALEPSATPTLIPPTPTISPAPAPKAPTDDAEPTRASEPAPAVEPIEWTPEEKNALSWMCQYEVGGMGAVRIDACLSVISTVRARYVYSSGLGTDVLSVLQWPGQFNIPIRTDEPNQGLIGVVEQYQNGARGSCNGYLYFDSVPGGPSLCVIYGAGGQFLDFHNGW